MDTFGIRSSRYFRICFIIITVIVFDQGTKYLVTHLFRESVVLNPAGTWGILPPWVAVIGFIGLLYFAWKQTHLTTTIAFILGAGISNGIDRLLNKAVIDFIRIGSFPVFNGADAVITLGAFYLIIEELRYNTRNKLKDN